MSERTPTTICGAWHRNQVMRGLEVVPVSRIDVEHKAEGVSLTLAAHGFSMNVELSQAEAEDLVRQLVYQGSAAAGSSSDEKTERRPTAERTQENSWVNC